MSYIKIEEPRKSKDKNWDDFEKLVADVFEKFNYNVISDERFKDKRWHQIDVIAFNDRYAFFIDCKYHKYIAPSKEIDFIKKQARRAKAYIKIDERLTNKKSFILLVTRYKPASLFSYNGEKQRIISVDINSLNDLLKNVEVYEDSLYSII